MISNSLGTRIILSVIMIVMLTVLSITVLTQIKFKEIFLKSIEENALNIMEATSNTIKLAHESILYQKSSTLARRKEELKNYALIAEAIIDNAYQKFKSGMLDEATAQKEALQDLEKIRWANGAGYFWINNTERPFPKMLMHPVTPELVGKVPDDPKYYSISGKNINIFTAFMDICESDGEGYVEYLYPKPTDQGITDFQPKISYVKLFKPWNWIIGTGVYIDDIEKDVQKRLNSVISELNRVVANYKISQSGYFFIFNEKNEILVHPNLSNAIKTPPVNPETNHLLLDEFKQAVRNGKNSMEYIWDKPGHEGSYSFRKKVFLSYFQPLGWYIATSYYKDDLEKNLSNVTWNIILIACMALISAILISILISQKMIRPLIALRKAVHKTGADGLPVEALPVSGTNEVMELGQTINNMVHTIRESKIRLKESEEKFRAVFNQTFQYVAILDKEGSIIDANLSSMELMDVGKSDLIGKLFWETPWWNHSTTLQATIVQAVRKSASGELIRFETYTQRADGSKIYVDFSVKPVLDDSGQVFALIAEGRDISKRKLSENALNESRENLRTILNAIGDGVIATDIQGRITSMNPVAEQLTGWRLSEIQGKKVSDVIKFIRTHTEELIESSLDKVLQTGTPAIGSKNLTSMINKDGKYLMIADSCSPIYDSNNNLQGAVLVFRDITEEHTMQEKLQHSLKMEALGELAGGVAHDINNMLGGIMGGAEMLQIQLERNPEALESVDIVMKACERSSELLKQLLAFARKSKINSTPLDVHQTIINTISLLKNTIDKRISVSYDLKPQKAIVLGDTSQMQSVFLNLGINAAHAMPAGGIIQFKSETILLDQTFCDQNSFDLHPGRYIQIEVKDTGYGIPPDNLNRIFEPFFTTRKQGEGTGLGLAAAYGTLLQSHGSITVSSKVNVGTVFTVLLPLISEEKKSDEISPVVHRIRKGGKIMVVDDEPLIRKSIKRYLEDFGYEVVLAENGSEGLDIFKEIYDTVDLVIMDMMMPVMNGEDCFNAMKSIDPDARVIIASGFTREADIERIKNKGLTGILRKPFRMTELIKTISEAIDNRRNDNPSVASTGKDGVDIPNAL